MLQGPTVHKHRQEIMNKRLDPVIKPELNSQLSEFFMENIEGNCCWFMVTAYVQDKAPATDRIVVIAYEQNKAPATDRIKKLTSKKYCERPYLSILVLKQRKSSTEDSKGWEEYRHIDIPIYEEQLDDEEILKNRMKIAIRELVYLPNFNLMLYYEEIEPEKSVNVADAGKEERRTYVSYIDLKKLPINYKQNRFEVTLDIQIKPREKDSEPYRDLRNKPVIRVTAQRDYMIIRADSTYISLIRTKDLENYSLESLLVGENRIEFTSENDMFITDFNLVKLQNSLSPQKQTAANANQLKDKNEESEVLVSYIMSNISTVLDLEIEGNRNPEGPALNMILKIALVKRHAKPNNRNPPIVKITHQLKLGDGKPTIGDIHLVYLNSGQLFCFILHDYIVKLDTPEARRTETAISKRLILSSIDLVREQSGMTFLNDAGDNINWRQIGLKLPDQGKTKEDNEINTILVNEQKIRFLAKCSIVDIQPSASNILSRQQKNTINLILLFRGGIETINFLKINTGSYYFKLWNNHGDTIKSNSCISSNIDQLCRSLSEHLGKSKNDIEPSHPDVRFAVVIRNTYIPTNHEEKLVCIFDQERRTSIKYRLT